MVVALAFVDGCHVKVAARDYRNPQQKNLVSDLTEFFSFGLKWTLLVQEIILGKVPHMVDFEAKREAKSG